MDFDSMKYAELRTIAKEIGLKANMKADKLLKSIKQHYEKEKINQEEEQGQEKCITAVPEDETVTQDSVEENKDSPHKEGVSSPTVFVNMRRGRKNAPKRKISDTATATDSDAKLPPSAAEGDTSSTPGNKRRRVSSDQSETKPPEQHQDIKDEAPVHGDTAPKEAKAGKIPRLKKKPALKTVTPNFKKLHEAHFNKMESIDSYHQRKTKQKENSVKKLKNPSDKTKLPQVDAKTQVKASQSRTSMFSPVPVNKRPAEDKRRHTVVSAIKAPPKKPAGKAEAPFRPSVLSTRRVNVRFSEATHDNEYKKSLVKTPARMSPCVASSTPQTQTGVEGKPKSSRTSIFSATKIPGPFVFTGNTSTSTTPGTQKKSAFDLKASLSRPLAYKPHSGKLKPFGETKENTAQNKSLIINSHQKNYKQHQVQTRGERRVKHMEDRKQKKESVLGARRGLVMM
ncbi:nucleolar and spindle-associated protein 1 isoform X2 [Centropristis striata]|uniref:nucleolar and spindle-associated protein 1 isoform X2 n=1 Tax=Centropristis striata TaxID=184440 RepID=UPI0027E06BB7|nr:nucleolar and spindle-associated protein 1 isoform X2 [Centropristis striata]